MVVLVVLIALVLAAPYVYQLLHKDNTINFKDFDKAIAQLSKIEQVDGYADDKPVSDDKLLHPVMFPFNPNSLTVAQWKQLGLSERQANVIIHYEAKGGRFYRKEDLKKIYAITADDYTRLEPYINIPEVEYISKKAKPGEIIELNGADSARMTMIRGVGPSFAVRIIRYRNRLGGFYNKEQLKEIYGVDSVYDSTVAPVWKYGFWNSMYVSSTASTAALTPVVGNNGNQVKFYASSSSLFPSDLLNNGNSTANNLFFNILATCASPVALTHASLQYYVKMFPYVPAIERDTVIVNTAPSYSYPYSTGHHLW